MTPPKEDGWPDYSKGNAMERAGYRAGLEAAAKVLDAYASEMADEAVAQFANLASMDVRELARRVKP